MNKLRIKIFFLALYFLLPLSGFGQLNNEPLQWQTIPADSAGLWLDLSTLGYFKNNEYFSVLEGFTLPGYQLNPSLRFQIDSTISISAGIFLNHYFGEEKIDQVSPFFRLKYQKKYFTAIFGNLEGALAHQLIEPLYDFDRLIYDRQENGLQFKWKDDHFYSDLWINWKQFIYPNDIRQEKFVAGYSGSYTPQLASENLKITIPIQLLARHLGGQINQPGRSSNSIFNYATGLEIQKKVLESKWIQSIAWKNYLVVNNAVFNENLGSRRGTGFYSNLSTQFKLFDLMLSYWYSDHFIGPEGGIIYSSIAFSDFYQGVTEAKRNLLIMRIMKNIKLSDFDLVMRFEPFYDFNNTTLEYSFGFYLNLTESFFLLKI